MEYFDISVFHISISGESLQFMNELSLLLDDIFVCLYKY